MGRPDGDASVEAVGRDASERATDTGDPGSTELTLPFFAHTIPHAFPSEYEPFGVYDRASDIVLGADEDQSPVALISRCFNCGNEEHTVKECPFRLDYNLIHLSRQYYKFLQETRGVVPANWQRVHVAESWRQTRLDWLDEFKPGEITGEMLKQALGPDESPWLRNMAIWGYPQGWVGVQDPRNLVRERIWKEHGGDVEDDLENTDPFIIFGDDGEPEQVDFANDFHSKTTYLHSPSENRNGCAKRWAEYPSTYFLSDLLPVHTGFNLPPIDGGYDAIPPPPPPPPPSDPPPLPPPPPSEPPPPLPPSHLLSLDPPPPLGDLTQKYPPRPPLPPSPPVHAVEGDSDMEWSDSD